MKIIGKFLVVATCALGTVHAFAVAPLKAQKSPSPSAINMALLGREILEPSDVPVRIEGKTLKTWKVDPAATKVHVHMSSLGRPVHCEISNWHGPDYTASTMKVYLEDGAEYPLNILMQPKGYGLDTVRVQNTASTDFPLRTAVGQDGTTSIYKLPEEIEKTAEPRLIQGAGAVKIYPLDNAVDRVAVVVKAEDFEARNIKFRLEVLQGPNNVKQSVEFYASNGYKTPFYGVFETPGTGYSIRMINNYSLEFPITAYVEPFTSD